MWATRTKLWTKHLSSTRTIASATGLSDFPKVYDPAYLERKWGDVELKACSASPDTPHFSMVLPPPNITGKLHLGHALTLSIQDAVVRWRHMLGDRVVWVPGMDHAGIATQVMVERQLWSEERVQRQQLGRSRFVERVEMWRQHRSEQINGQMRRLGVALDWQRSLFTLDKDYSEAVGEAFVRLFDMGLLYRGERIVNWCCQLQSVVSDIEVEHRSVESNIVDIAYPWVDECDVELVVSTTRPETLLGDVAVAVHPMDPRYERWIGRKLQHPLLSHRQPLPVVADQFVTPEFGTGAVKITPAHDPVDFDVAARHGLPMISIFTEDGRINHNGAQFQGLSRDEARAAVMAALRQKGLLRGERPHQMSVPVCSRTGDVIEPMVKQQWFVRCEGMAARALDAVQNGDLLIDPVSNSSVWREWLKHCKDWCVSRQLWWGHRIPAYCVTRADDGTSHWVAARSQDEAIQKLGLTELQVSAVQQDDDVLDTWFSSALLPFAAFGWPRETCDLRQFYPLSLMETGHDILFFWVARMVMLAQTLTGQLPFKRVVLHGMICDGHGRKMSKSKGNVIDPEDVIDGATLADLQQRVSSSLASGVLSEQQAREADKSLHQLYPNGITYAGTDGLRFALCSADLRGLMVSVDMEGIRQARLFCNKIWQAASFVRSNVDACQYQCDPETRHRRLLVLSNPLHCWMLSCLRVCVERCSSEMSEMRLHRATRAIDRLVRSQLCDVYLEAVKPTLRSDDVDGKRDVCDVLLAVLDVTLGLLHPFMPRLTEELGQWLHPYSGDTRPVHQRVYPAEQQWIVWSDTTLVKAMDTCLDITRAVRDMKVQRSIGKTCPTVYVSCGSVSDSGLLPVLSTLAGCRAVAVDDSASQRQTLLLEGQGWSSRVQIEFDRDAELARIDCRRDVVLGKLKQLSSVVESKKFQRKTAASQQYTRQKKSSLETELKQLQQQQNDILTGSAANH